MAASQGGGEAAPERRSAHPLCRVALIGVMLALLLGLPFIADRIIYFDVFAQFRIHLLIAAFALGICMLLPGRRGQLAALAILLAGVGSIGLWARQHLLQTPADSPLPGVLRVMSFNTWASNRNVAAVATSIRQQKPDIVGLVEYNPPKTRLPQYLRHLYPHTVDCVKRPHCYIGLLSRWPIVKWHARSLWRGPPYLHAVVRTPQGLVDVYVVHTLRFPWAHAQWTQVRVIADIVRKRNKGKRPLIVMGDFNATPFSRVIRHMDSATGLTRHTWLPTWPTWFAGLPQLGIDHIFTSSHFERVRGPWLGDNAGSDHFPVVLELRAVR